ncbi:DUF4150 domain-containing protein [Aliikangiella coralliicola]|uniref:DUF4150 domain-containing protein n=2 Tax=Aliikangiella coralliicola TaxID=2592383 RepID=A0A545UDA2_9GAMM|nr:DUF4150 domain-containing protein [Aliikangiella coralliicola]
MFSISFAFPDVCYVQTPVGPVPVPLVNFAFSTLAIPNVINIFITAMPVHNLLTTTPISSGDELGAPQGGVVSAMFISEKRNLLSSFKTFFSCIPSTRMLDLSGQNGLASNIPGMNLSPSQVKVIILS